MFFKKYWRSFRSFQKKKYNNLFSVINFHHPINIAALLNMDSTTDVIMKKIYISIFVEGKKLKGRRPRAKGRGNLTPNIFQYPSSYIALYFFVFSFLFLFEINKRFMKFLKKICISINHITHIIPILYHVIPLIFQKLH